MLNIKENPLNKKNPFESLKIPVWTSLELG